MANDKSLAGDARQSTEFGTGEEARRLMRQMSYFTPREEDDVLDGELVFFSANRVWWERTGETVTELADPFPVNESRVYFRSARCDLDGAAKALSGIRLVVERSENALHVQFPGGPTFRVIHVAGVPMEASEIAGANQQAAALLPCDSQFAIQFDPEETAQDEFNTLALIQEALEKATGGFSFNTWNGEFPGRTCNP